MDGRGQRGNVIVLVALALVGLMGFAAVAVDVGYFVWQRQDLQRVADAAALAGIQELPEDPTAAVAVAADYAQRNGAGSHGWVLESVRVVNGTSLEVRISHPDAPFFLGRVLGFHVLDVTARATAAVQSPVRSDNVMPWALRESARQRAQPGDVVTVKYSAGSGSQGDYGALSVIKRGSSQYEENIKNGVTLELFRTYEVETGNMTGATRDGMTYRLGNTDPACDTFAEVFQQVEPGTWRFRNEACNPWSPIGQGSKRVVLIPVIADDADPGRGQVTAIGFALAFLEDFTCPSGNECDVQVRFVQALMSPDDQMLYGNYDSRSGLKVVRLVQ
ncbi:MAG TPA: Tad domain-containing protein [Dehalococcoidia bacterium]|nr:Tad domain-containing protein [Dehalococcoidia bacterium]